MSSGLRQLREVPSFHVAVVFLVYEEAILEMVQTC
jgi:hypothetical protein